MLGHGPRGFIVAVGLGLAACGSAPAEETTAREPNCGLNALFLLAKLSGGPADLGRIERALPARRAGGYSMAELRAGGRAVGLDLQGVRFGKRDVPLDRPAIAFLDTPGEGHFVALQPVGSMGTMVQVLDPPYAPALVDYSQLLARRSWSGRLLVRRTTAEYLTSWAWLPLLVVLIVLLCRPIRRHFTRRSADPIGRPHVTA